MRTDPAYKEMTQHYTRTDALLAVGFYILTMFTYLAMGMIQSNTGVYLGIYINLLLMGVIFLIVRFRKHKLDTVGFTKKCFIKSAVVGLLAGAFFSLLNIIPALQAGGRWTASGLLINIFYYLIVIGLQEELLFRGFIQTRLYGAIKSDLLAVVVGGVMFATMHTPFQMYNRGVGNIVEFIAGNWVWLLMTFGWHFVFNYLYRRFNSLTAPTAAHWLMNLSNTLVR
jgi:membrane protease YdiL (CAAX protease family)